MAKAGFTDVVLLERTELTAGSTWHAAGGTGAFGGSANATFLHKYSFEIYLKLEAETGQSCGFHHVGEITLGHTDARVEQMKLHHTLAKRNLAGTITNSTSPPPMPNPGAAADHPALGPAALPADDRE